MLLRQPTEAFAETVALVFGVVEHERRSDSGVGSGRASIVSFNVNGMKPQDVELALDREGIIVRSGALNARILMRRLDLPGALSR
jgi:selenocysteine lyase/cysteine desulfurase